MHRDYEILLSNQDKPLKKHLRWVTLLMVRERNSWGEKEKGGRTWKEKGKGNWWHRQRSRVMGTVMGAQRVLVPEKETPKASPQSKFPVLWFCRREGVTILNIGLVSCFNFTYKYRYYLQNVAQEMKLSQAVDLSHWVIGSLNRRLGSWLCDKPLTHIIHKNVL